MKLLVIGDIGIIYTFEYITEIVSQFKDCSVDILSFAPRSEKNEAREKRLNELGCNVFYPPQYKLFKKSRLLYPFIRIGEMLRYRICRKYDVINIHFPGVDSWAACLHASKNTRIVTSIYGSDLLRASGKGLEILKKVLSKSDAVTVGSDYVLERTSKACEGAIDAKLRKIRYGANAAAAMHEFIEKYTRDECKETFAFPTDRISVLCGYNGSRSQRHLEMINLMKELPEEYQSKLFLVFQCSYGFDEVYSKELSAALAESGLNGVIVTDFMQGETLAKFRKAMDIFLNLQPTDAFSATMVEELESGAVVVKGDWLCYPDLDEVGIYMKSIPDMENLPAEIVDIIENLDAEKERTKKNKGVWELLSWEALYDKWESVILNKES